MELEIKTWLYNILNAIQEIDFFIDGNYDISIELYRNDLKTKRAIERNIEIIGEATNRIIKNHPNIFISEARKIIDLRNKIIHGYDIISDELILGILKINIPILEKEIKILLNE